MLIAAIMLLVTAQSANAPQALVERFFDAIDRGDDAEADALLSPDAGVVVGHVGGEGLTASTIREMFAPCDRSGSIDSRVPRETLEPSITPIAMHWSCRFGQVTRGMTSTVLVQGGRIKGFVVQVDD